MRYKFVLDIILAISCLSLFGCSSAGNSQVCPDSSPDNQQACCSNSQISDTLIEQRISEMLAAHPQSTLQDIYKSCFQDLYGPGHLISDTASCLNYLRSEISADDYIDTIKYEPTGIHGNFVRTNLCVIKDGEISEDDLLNALIESAQMAPAPPVEEWREQWSEIVSTIRSMDASLPNFENDATMIDSLLASGKYVMHHSDIFQQTYHPHYRIIKTEVLDSILK